MDFKTYVKIDRISRVEKIKGVDKVREKRTGSRTRRR